MIASRRRDERAGAGRAAFQSVDIGKAAAHLEGAGGVVVLVLDDDVSAEPPREQRPAQRRGGGDRVVHEGFGGFELGEGEHGCVSLIGRRGLPRSGLGERSDAIQP